MALTDAYATVQEYRDAKGGRTAANDLEILRDLEMASRYIDRELGWPLGFNIDTADVVRVVDVRKPGCRVDIPNHASITTLKLDDGPSGTFSTTLTATDYELLPRNATTRPEQQPYRQILLTEWGSVGTWVPGWRIEITGKGGWPAVPAAIRSGCIELTAIWRVESPRATNTVNEFNQIIGMSSQSKSIVDKFLASYRNPAVYP